MRAPFDDDSTPRLRAQKGRQNRLENKRCTAGSADGKPVFSSANRLWRKHQRGGAQRRPIDFRGADLCSSQNGRQVLAQKARVPAAGANVFDLKWNSRRQGKAEGGPQNLTAAFPKRPIDSNHLFNL